MPSSLQDVYCWYPWVVRPQVKLNLPGWCCWLPVFVCRLCSWQSLISLCYWLSTWCIHKLSFPSSEASNGSMSGAPGTTKLESWRNRPDQSVFWTQLVGQHCKYLGVHRWWVWTLRSCSIAQKCWWRYAARWLWTPWWWVWKTIGSWLYPRSCSAICSGGRTLPHIDCKFRNAWLCCERASSIFRIQIHSLPRQKYL